MKLSLEEYPAFGRKYAHIMTGLTIKVIDPTLFCGVKIFEAPYWEE